MKIRYEKARNPQNEVELHNNKSAILLSEQSGAIKKLILQFLSGSDLNSTLSLNKDFNRQFKTLSSAYRILHLRWQLNVALPQYAYSYEERITKLQKNLVELKKLKSERLKETNSQGALCSNTGEILGACCCAAGVIACTCTGFLQCSTSLLACGGPPPVPPSYCSWVIALVSSQCSVYWGGNCYPLATPCVVGYGLMGSAVMSILSSCSLGWISRECYTYPLYTTKF